MKNALILHGSGNDHTGNWFPWLKNELEKEGYKVWVPDLPGSDVPDREKYLKTIFANKEWDFNSESIIAGHSSGATLILRILEELPPGIKIYKALLAAGPATLGSMPQYYPYKESLVEGSFVWDKIKKSCEKFYFFGSDNDQYDCGINQAKIFQRHLGGELVLLTGEKHFNLESSPKYIKFPKLLQKILE
jgi:predicted alpha/beta hydrolase family esterase